MAIFKCGACRHEAEIIDESCDLIHCTWCEKVYDWKSGCHIEMGDQQLTSCVACGYPNTHSKDNSTPTCCNCHRKYKVISDKKEEEPKLEFETKMLTAINVKFDMNTTPSIRAMNCIAQIFSSFKLDYKNKHAVVAWVNAQYGKDSE